MLQYTYIAKSEELESIDENTLSNYQYLAVFQFPENDIVSKVELQMMRNAIGRFMKGSVLFIESAALQKCSNEVVTCYCDVLPQLESLIDFSITLICIAEGVNDSLYFEPYTQTFTPTDSEKYSHLGGLHQSLDILKGRLTYLALESFRLPASNSRSKNSCIPNSKLIHELRSKIGSQEDFMDKINAEVKQRGLTEIKSKATLSAMENYTPTEMSQLNKLGLSLNITVERLQLHRAVLDKAYFRGICSETRMNAEKLAVEFGVSSPYFFTLLEESETIPEKVLRFLFYRMSEIYSELFPDKSKLSLKRFIDIPATESLVQKPK